MPFDTTRVVPAGWSQHHAAVAAGGMNATIHISDPNAQTRGWDATTESTTITTAEPVYAGPARIQEVMSAEEATQTGQQVTERRYLLQILFDAAPVQQGWAVRVTDCPNDTELVAWTTTRPMTVTDVQMGSERFTRDLIATINLD